MRTSEGWVAQDDPWRQTREVDTYVGLLADAMRTRGTPTATIREATDEVRAHCAATGQPPLTAFGRPEVLARRYRAEQARSVIARLAATAAGAVGLVAVVFGLTGQPAPGGTVLVPPVQLAGATALLFAFLCLPWGIATLERRLPWRATSTLPDRPWVPAARLAVLVVAMVLLLAAMSAVAPAVLETEPVAQLVRAGHGQAPVELARSVLLVVGCVLFPLTVLAAPARRTSR